MFQKVQFVAIHPQFCGGKSTERKKRVKIRNQKSENKKQEGKRAYQFILYVLKQVIEDKLYNSLK
jgi:hypothetical protein